MFYNAMPMNYGRQRVQGVYTHTQTRECSRSFMTSDAFRVLLRSVASGCKGGSFQQEDAVELYGFRVREKDGTIAAVITDVVESSPSAKRSGCTFDVDNDYSLHRDQYIRDRHTNSNFSLLGYIHSHPGRLITFSQQDVDTMAMYAPEVNVFVSGLVTLSSGNLECTMYACTWENGRLLIWNLPFLVSDEEAYKRLPREQKKGYDAIWKEATGSGRVPRLCMLETSMDEMMSCEAFSRTKREEAPAAQSRYNIDVSGIPEGGEGLLCGMMVNGKLSLFLKPMVQVAEAAALKPEQPAEPEADDKPAIAPEKPAESRQADIAPEENAQEQQPAQGYPGDEAVVAEEETKGDEPC